ncbi:hypothetical protein M9458_007516, partial [Cirrhinus mrigala]
KWSWSLRSAMMETENKLHNKIENGTIDVVEETDLQRELMKTSVEVKDSMSEFFEKKKKIDAQRTHHENTLYEKSKELALKYKDKANNAVTLKKEFDLFWKQSVKKIITDPSLIKDIDIMRDLTHILKD